MVNSYDNSSDSVMPNTSRSVGNKNASENNATKFSTFSILIAVGVVLAAIIFLFVVIKIRRAK